MASRVSYLARHSLRAGGSRLVYASRASSHSKVAAIRRGMASSSHAHETKSDTPWIIGSALLFGPTLIYLLGPARKSKNGHGDPHADPHSSKHDSVPAPVTQKTKQEDQTPDAEDDAAGEQLEKRANKEDNEAPVDESPDGKEAKDVKTANDPEEAGSSSSQEDEKVKASIQQALAADAPKSAKVEEEKKSE